MAVEVLLHVLAVLHAAGIDRPKKDLASFYCGRESGRKNTGFTLDCADAKRSGLVEYPEPGTIRLTDAGRAHLNVEVRDPPRSNERIHDHILATLEAGHRSLQRNRSLQMFQMLRDGQARPLEQVARDLGYRGSRTTCFGKFLKKEKDRGLVVVDRKRRTVALAEFAFPFGHP